MAPLKVLKIKPDHGSGSSLDALVWAAGLARLTGARLRLVTCWQLPRPFGYDLAYEDWRPEDDAVHVQEQALASLGDSLADVTTESRIVEGEPARVLVEEAKAADLLVVGSRGHRELVGMLLGSVSEFCAAHASCPVVVVHEGERGAEWLKPEPKKNGPPERVGSTAQRKRGPNSRSTSRPERTLGSPGCQRRSAQPTNGRTSLRSLPRTWRRSACA